MLVSSVWFVASTIAWLTVFSGLPSAGAQRKVRVGILLNTKRALGAKVAIDLVNRGGSDILTGVQVEYAINHTQNNRYIALEAARWQVEVFKAKAIVGPEFSSVAAVVAPYCAGRHVPLISPSATDPLLSDTSQYPYFARTVSSDTLQGKALFSFLRAFNWTRVSILHSKDNYGRNGLLEFEKLAQRHGVNIIRKSEVSIALDNVNSSIQRLKEDRSKIQIVNVHRALGNRLIEGAFDAGMMGKGYAWLATDGMTSDASILSGHARGLIGTAPAVSSGLAKTNFLNQLGPSLEIEDNYAYYAADAVNLLLRAVQTFANSSSNLSKQFFWENTTYQSDAWRSIQNAYFYEHVINASFDGVTGKVKIDENGDREGLPGYNILNYQSSNSFHTVGDWNVENGLSLRGSGGIVWPGNQPWFKHPQDSDTLQTTVKILTYEFDPFFYCKCGKKCKECNNTDPSGRIIDNSKTQGFIVDMLSYLQKLPYLGNFKYEVYTWGNVLKEVAYNSTCTKGDNTGCISGWKCTSNSVCTSLWYNVTGKEPLRDTGTNYVKAVARGDFDIGAGDNFVTESRAKITQFSVPYMTTGVTLVRRRDTLEQTVKPPVDRK